MFVSTRYFIFLFACVIGTLWLLGCTAPRPATSAIIEFRHVPPSAIGGAGDTEVLSGVVRHASADARLVIYVHARDTWYVQPLTRRPFTAVGRNGKWSTATHLGNQYAAMLVSATYRPANTLRELPQAKGPVLAVRSTVGDPSSVKAEHYIHFSTYEWSIREMGSDRHGAVHTYDASNVWVDGADRLHLRVARNGNDCTCSEVALRSSLGYGLYVLRLENAKKLEPATVFDIFTWDPTGTDQDRREMGTELTRWGDPEGKNAEYVVQPFFRPTNTYRYSADTDALTLTMRWRNGRVDFTTAWGGHSGRRMFQAAEHSFTSDVPSPNKETIHLNLCTFDYGKVKQTGDSEVLVDSFRYLP